MPHTILQRSGYCFWGLIITRPTRHFRDIHHYKYDIILVPISFPHPSVSWVLYYILCIDNVHNVYTVIQYPLLANYEDQQKYSTRRTISGVSLLQGFKNTGVQEHQMPGNSIIIMPSPVKVIIMNRQYNTSIRCNSIQSGATTSGQVYQYQVKAYQSSGVRYQVSGIRC